MRAPSLVVSLINGRNIIEGNWVQPLSSSKDKGILLSLTTAITFRAPGVTMAFNPSRIDDAKNETKTELLSWQEHCKVDSAQHMTATVELARRGGRSGQIRYWTVFAVVAVSMLSATVVLIRYWW